jgi:hypothetical protein
MTIRFYRLAARPTRGADGLPAPQSGPGATAEIEKWWPIIKAASTKGAAVAALPPCGALVYLQLAETLGLLGGAAVTWPLSARRSG